MKKNNLYVLKCFSRPLLLSGSLKTVKMPLLYLTLFLLQGLPSVYAAEMNTAPIQDCEINTGPCVKKIDAVSVSLDITPKPVKAMKELLFTVTLKGAKDYDSLRLKLQMPGMFMGNNEVTLVKAADGKYTGKGVVPKCHSGNRLWSATLDLPGLKTPEIPFLFNVLY